VVYNVYSRAMRKAIALYEGKDKLARYLNVPVAEIDKWLSGEEPPRDIFLRVIDIILDETGSSDDGSAAGDSSPSRDASAGRAQRD
jgi:hypothetical protein